MSNTTEVIAAPAAARDATRIEQDAWVTRVFGVDTTGQAPGRARAGATSRVAPPADPLAADKAEMARLEPARLDLVARGVALQTETATTAAGLASLEELSYRPDAERPRLAATIVTALKKIQTLDRDFKTFKAGWTPLEAGARARAQGSTDPATLDFAATVADRTRAANDAMARSREAMPDGFLRYIVEDDIDAVFAPLVEVDPAKRRQALAAATTDAKRQEAHDDAGHLTAAVGKYQPRGMSQASAFFDAATRTVAMSAADQRTAMAASDAIARKGRAILMNGGTYDDVKAFMKDAGLAEEWWPPELVDSIQAWRKAQRALNRERAETSATPTTLETWQAREGTAEGVLGSNALGLAGAGFSADGARRTGGDSSAPAASSTAVQVDTIAGDLAGVIGSIPNAIEFFRSGFKAIEGLTKPDRDKLKNALDRAATAINAGLGAAASSTQLASDLGAQVIAAAVPGLNIASAGANLLMAFKTLAEHQVVASATRTLQTDTRASLGRGEASEADMNSLQNEITARKQQAGKDAVNIFGQAANFAGAVSTTAGGAHGAVAAAALSVIGNTVCIGSAIAFNAIDWSAAERAKETIREAAAGNMTAQVQVFKDSGFYAKMHICLLCRDDVAMGRKFVIDRGLEEGDLDNATGLRVLREALLASADQVDDTQVEGSAVTYALGRVGTALSAAGSAIGAGAAAAGHAARSLATKPYDKAWRAASGTPLDATAWATVKGDAIAHGLVDSASGIGAALTAAAPALAAADAIDATATSAPPPTARKTLLAAIAQCRLIRAKLAGYSPEAYVERRPVGHAGMAEVLAGMIELANTTETRYWAKLEALGLHDMVWDPKAAADLASRAIGAAEWQRLWQEGVTRANLPVEDSGVAAALAAAEAAQAAFDGASRTDGQAWRKQGQATVGLWAKAGAAMLVAIKLPEVGTQPKLTATIDLAMLGLLAQQRTVNETMVGAQGGASTWTTAPTLDTTSAAALATSWGTLWTEAAAQGFCDAASGDAGLKPALDAFSAATTSIDGTDGQKALAAFLSLEELAGTVRLAAAGFGRVQRYAADQLRTAATEAATAATRIAKEKRAASPAGTADFAVGATYDVAGWQTTYANAVAANAVLASKEAQDLLAGALKWQADCKKAHDKAMTGTDPRKKREAAATFADALTGTIRVAGTVGGLQGYARSAKMTDYIKNLVAATTTAREAIDDVSNGTSSTFAPVTTKGLDADEWSDNRRVAIAAGVIADESTGLRDALQGFATARKDAGKAKLADQPAAKRKALAALGNVETRLVPAREMSKNPHWLAYINGLLAACSTERALLA